MKTPTIKIVGVGAYTVDILVEHGYSCAEDLAATSEAVLSKVPGFGPARAKLIINAAKDLCDAGNSNRESSPSSTGTKQAITTIDADIKAEVAAVIGPLGGKDPVKEKKKKKKKKAEKEKKKIKSKAGKKDKKSKKKSKHDEKPVVLALEKKQLKKIKKIKKKKKK